MQTDYGNSVTIRPSSTFVMSPFKKAQHLQHPTTLPDEIRFHQAVYAGLVEKNVTSFRPTEGATVRFIATPCILPHYSSSTKLARHCFLYAVLYDMFFQKKKRQFEMWSSICNGI